MTIPHIKQWFVEAVPNPTHKNRAVQIGCHYEELAEMVAALGWASPHPSFHSSIVSMAEGFKKVPPTHRMGDDCVDRQELLDSLCDQIVTAVGVAHMFGLDIEGALAEVDRSNWSKFVNGRPVFDENGKIAKPATYAPPDLTPFV